MCVCARVLACLCATNVLIVVLPKPYSVGDGVHGVVVSDAAGLCLTANGTGTSEMAGFASAMMERAASLSDSVESPTISIEADST